LPGLTRQSIIFVKSPCEEDGCAGLSAFTRVFDALLPAHDVLEKAI
jgi:hypothetical protein